MPMRAQVNTTSGQIYGRCAVGITEYTAQRLINVAALTTAEVDIDGYLKPGVPFDRAGLLIATGVPVFGVSIEPIKVAIDNTSGNLTAAGNVQVTLMTIGQINRAIAADNLGRAYTGFETAGFDLAGSKIVLLY